MNKVAGAGGAVIALTAVLAIGAVAYDTGETPSPHSNADLGLEWWIITFEYPDGTTETEPAINYVGAPGGLYENLGNDFRLRADQYPDPPDGYGWDHGPDHRYTEDTVVKAVPISRPRTHPF